MYRVGVDEEAMCLMCLAFPGWHCSEDARRLDAHAALVATEGRLRSNWAATQRAALTANVLGGTR